MQHFQESWGYHKPLNQAQITYRYIFAVMGKVHDPRLLQAFSKATHLHRISDIIFFALSNIQNYMLETYLSTTHQVSPSILGSQLMES